jgi:hypothetical protein
MNTQDEQAHLAEGDDQAKIERLHALANDQQHIRRNALRIAGYLLQASEEDAIQNELNSLDEEIVEDGGELYQAYEQLFQAFADEVVKIGRELSQQAKKGSNGH